MTIFGQFHWLVLLLQKCLIGQVEHHYCYPWLLKTRIARTKRRITSSWMGTQETLQIGYSESSFFLSSSSSSSLSFFLLLFFIIFLFKCYHSWSQLPLTSNGNSSSRKSKVEVKVVGSIPIGRVITDKIIFYHNWNMFVLSCDLDKHYIVSRGRELKSMARIWKMATQAILTLQWMVYR